MDTRVDLRTCDVVRRRIDFLLQSGKTSEEIQQIFLSEEYHVVDLNGLIGVKVGNTTCYHEKL